MKKIYILPNMVTTANMFCGFLSVVYTMDGEFLQAAIAILGAIFFDALDGRIARMARATSSFGVEYDSLSDLVSFGIAPALLIYVMALKPYGRLGWLAAFLFMVCGALRLARFNVTTEKLPKGFFLGLPIPGAAGTIAAFVIFFENSAVLLSQNSFQVVMLILSLGLSSLMVSTIYFPSFKEVNWRSKAAFGLWLAIMMTVILIAARPDLFLFVMTIVYIFGSLIWNVFAYFKGTLPERTPLSVFEKR